MMNNRQPTVADIHLSTALASEMDNLSPHLRYAYKQWMQSLAWDQEYMDGVVAHTVIASERWPEYKDARTFIPPFEDPTVDKLPEGFVYKFEPEYADQRR